MISANGRQETRGKCPYQPLVNLQVHPLKMRLWAICWHLWTVDAFSAFMCEAQPSCYSSVVGTTNLSFMYLA